MASSVPCTSALMIRLSAGSSPSRATRSRSSEARAGRLAATSRGPLLRAALLARCGPRFSSATARNRRRPRGRATSPAPGRASPARPPAGCRSRRTWPEPGRPTRRRGRRRRAACLAAPAAWRSGPRPLSRCASMVTPSGVGGRVRLQLQEVGHQQDRLEERVQVLARLRRDVDELVLAAPSAGISPARQLLATRCGSASSLSTLLTATMIGTPAALAWFSASTVCGITPSSAATTSTTMSVISAPRARMAVNARGPACR